MAGSRALFTEMLADVLANGADVLGRITVTRNAWTRPQSLGDKEASDKA